MAAVESGLPKVQQEPSVAFQIAVDNDGTEIVPTDEPRMSSSKQSRQENVELSWKMLSIYRIPHYLKYGDEAYVPQIVSFGPYHHGKEHLRHMDQHKSRCFSRILERSHHERGLYLDSVKEVEQRARACYEGIISMSSDDFVEMMVLDGCFVIEVFLASANSEALGYHRNDPIFSRGTSILKTQIQRDMIKLENQIPLFILDRLLSLQLGKPDQENRVVELALQFFSPWTPFWGIRVEMEFPSDPCRLHCLGAYWSNALPLSAKQAGTKALVGIMRWSQRHNFCVTKLREAGIVFQEKHPDTLGDSLQEKHSDSLGDSLGNIKFLDGILCIPKLTIDEGTRSLFLNLIAFEQCHIHCEKNITSYVIFMHNLIHSPEDVGHLRHHMIIEHCFGSDAQVVDLFNRLCQEVSLGNIDGYLGYLRIEVSLYCLRKRLPFKVATAAFARKWNFWGADLKKKYFNNPWSTISVIAASILLVLTFTQTFYGVLSYHRPPRS